MGQAIFVTGCARSGTSLTAGLLAQLGVFVGETVGKSKYNPEGFFENKAIREHLTKRILKSNDADPLGINPLPAERCVFPSFHEAVIKQLKMEGYDGGPWLYKDAKLLLMWHLWQREFKDPKWIIVRREPQEIVRSCLRTPFMAQHSEDPEFWHDIVREYESRMDELSANADCMEVWPAEWLRGDYTSLKALCDWLGIEFDPLKVGDFINPQHWHGLGGKEKADVSIHLNVDHDLVNGNVRAALKRDIRWLDRDVAPHKERMCIVGGGPSLKKTLPHLRKQYRKGARIMALNGAYNFLLKHGITPWGMCMMDARPENAEFVKNPRKETTFFIASMCHPDVFDRLEHYNVVGWHADVGADTMKIARESGINALCNGYGCTVGLRVLSIANALGFRDLHIYGMDSCYDVAPDGKRARHHAYTQTLNDNERVGDYWLGDKRFFCSAWQAKQIEEFIGWYEKFGHRYTVRVHGGGPLAYVVKFYGEKAA